MIIISVTTQGTVVDSALAELQILQSRVRVTCRAVSDENLVAVLLGYLGYRQ